MSESVEAGSAPDSDVHMVMEIGSAGVPHSGKNRAATRKEQRGGDMMTLSTDHHGDLLVETAPPEVADELLVETVHVSSPAGTKNESSLIRVSDPPPNTSTHTQWQAFESKWQAFESKYVGLCLAVTLATCLILGLLWFVQHLEVLEDASSLLLMVVLTTGFYTVTYFTKSRDYSILSIVVLATLWRLVLGLSIWRWREGSFLDLVRVRQYSSDQLARIWLIGLLSGVCYGWQINMIWKMDALTCEVLISLQFLLRASMCAFAWEQSWSEKVQSIYRLSLFALFAGCVAKEVCHHVGSLSVYGGGGGAALRPSQDRVVGYTYLMLFCICSSVATILRDKLAKSLESLPGEEELSEQRLLILDGRLSEETSAKQQKIVQDFMGLLTLGIAIALRHLAHASPTSHVPLQSALCDPFFLVQSFLLAAIGLYPKNLSQALPSANAGFISAMVAIAMGPMMLLIFGEAYGLPEYIGIGLALIGLVSLSTCSVASVSVVNIVLCKRRML